MTPVELQELRASVIENYDAEYLLDVLGISNADLVDAFEQRLIENRYSFGWVDEEEECK